MDKPIAINALRESEMNGYQKVDQYNPGTVRRIADKYHDILRDLGENPEREGLAKTPERVAKALQFLTHGYDLDPAAILRSAMFKEEYQQMVIEAYAGPKQVIRMRDTTHWQPVTGRAEAQLADEIDRLWERAVR